MSTVEYKHKAGDPPIIHARVVMDPLEDQREFFDDWRDEINALLLPETVRNFVQTDSGNHEMRDIVFLPEHELHLDVTAPFVPTELRGVLCVSGEQIGWVATLDVDASHSSARWMRKNIFVFNVVQDGAL